MEALRFRAVKMLAADPNKARVALALNVSRQSVHKWARSHAEGGRRALAARPQGRPRKVSDQVARLWWVGARRADIERALKRPPASWLVEPGSVNRSTVLRTLRAAGLSPQRRHTEIRWVRTRKTK